MVPPPDASHVQRLGEPRGRQCDGSRPHVERDMGRADARRRGGRSSASLGSSAANGGSAARGLAPAMLAGRTEISNMNHYRPAASAILAALVVFGASACDKRANRTSEKSAPL